jgi:tetratricopeptide (TPR) repeat protein
MRHACRRMRGNFSKGDRKGKRMARKIKYTRKDLKGPDEFISTLGRATLWIQENRFPVLAALTAVILAAGGVFGTRAYYRWQEAKANRDLWPQLIQAQEILRSPEGADEEKLDRLEKSLAGQVSAHPGTEAAVFAQYYLGSIAFRRGNYNRSADYFRSAIASGKEQGTILDFLLREGLAQTFDAKGDAENAEKAYEEAARFATGEFRTQARMGQARALATLGHKQEAAEVLRKILAETPDTPRKELIQIQLSRLE